MARLGAWVALAVLTLYLVFFGGGWMGIYLTELRTTSMIVAGAVLACWAIIALRQPDWRPRSVLLPAILACIGSLAISTVFSRHPRLSVEYVGYAIVLGALYLLLVRILAHPWLRERMSALVVMLAFGIGSLFMILVVGHWIAWWGLVGRVTVPPLRPNFEGLLYGNPSTVMTISVMLTTAAVASVGVASRRRAVVSLALVALAAPVTLISGSRAGWLGVAVAAVLTAGVVIVSAAERDQAARAIAWLRASRPARVAAGVLGILGLGALVAFAPAILRRALEGGEDVRGTFAAIALRLFSESPLVGVGPGMWVVSRTKYTIAPDVDYYIPHAHNIWLQTPAELGMVGLGAGAVLLLSLAWLVRDGMRDANPNRKRWAWAALFALLYFGAHQALDFYANMAAVLFTVAVPVAWLDATAARPIAFRRLRLSTGFRRPVGAIAGMITAVAVIGLLVTEIPAGRSSEAIALANVGDWAQAAPLAHEAVAMDPAWPPYQLTAALTDLQIGQPERAATELRAVTAVDDFPEAWLALAKAELELGRADASREAIRRALRLGYQRAAVSMAAGDLALAFDRSLAVDAFADAVESAPSLAADPYWDRKDPTLLGDVVEMAMRSEPDGRHWEIALMAGDVERARTLVAALVEPDRALALDVLDAWLGDTSAHARVDARCNAEPLNLGPLAWCARIAGHAGDRKQQNRYLFWTEAIIGGAAAAGVELRVATHEMIGRSDSGDPATFWGYYTYRRPTPWDIIPKGLIHLTYG